MNYNLASIIYDLHFFMHELEGEQKERYEELIEKLQEELTCGSFISD